MNHRRQTDPIRVTPRGIIATLVLFIVAAACIRLGFWQLERRDQRQASNDALRERMEATAVAVTGALHDTTGLRYRRATAHGTWDAGRSIVLPGRSWQGAPGAHVLTPLLLADGSAILVNRGWAPAADGATVDSAAFLAPASASVEGLVDFFPGRDESLAPRAGAVEAGPAFRRVWFAIDEQALRAQFPYPIIDLTLRELPRDQVREPPPIALQPPALDPGPHLGYAIQWFSFAAIALIGWTVMVLRRSPTRDA